MSMLEVDITIRLQVNDTKDKVSDCLTAIEEAKKLINAKPGYELLRTKRLMITRLARKRRDSVRDLCDPLPPLSIDNPIEPIDD